MKFSTILSGVVGSKAYGLDNAHSDTDILGLYVVPTINLTLLTRPKETIVHTQPDITMHEVGKYCSLALKCNPTVLELMWLEEHLVKTDLGDSLISNREFFLSAPYVKNAYLGYAKQQVYRIRRQLAQGPAMDDLAYGQFLTESQYKMAKHARHIYRLLLQGLTLWTTRELPIRLTSSEARDCRDFGELVSNGDLHEAEETIEMYERLFENQKTKLPEVPDTFRVESWLATVRSYYITASCIDWEEEKTV